jgi:membrane fusion protein (multidrug efflux system)
MMKNRKNRVVSLLLLSLLLLAPAFLSCSSGEAEPGGDDRKAQASARGRTKGFGGRAKGGRPGGPPGGKEQPAVPVETAVIETDDMEAFLDGSSTLYAEETVDVVSQATGVVVEVLAEEGDRVRKGELLARMDYEELELAERRARSEFERLQANFQRAGKLQKEDLIAEEDFQQIKFDLARAEIDRQQAELDLEHTRILSPISGTVVSREIRVGQLVRENDTVYQMVDFNSLVAPVFLPEKYLGNLRAGQQAFLTTPSLGDRKIPGAILRISPMVDSQSGTVEVTVGLKESDDLRPGMFASVQLVLDRHLNVVVIQKRAIVYDNELPYVFVVENGTASRRRINLGYQDETRAEVTSGLEEGEVIVVVGQSALKDGSTVAEEVQPS